MPLSDVVAGLGIEEARSHGRIVRVALDRVADPAPVASEPSPNPAQKAARARHELTVSDGDAQRVIAVSGSSAPVGTGVGVAVGSAGRLMLRVIATLTPPFEVLMLPSPWIVTLAETPRVTASWYS